MSVWDTFKRLGFFQGEDEESETEMDENEIEDQDEEEGEEDESQNSRFAFFSNSFRRNPSGRASQREQEDEPADDEEPPVRTTRRGNVIHDSRMNGRSEQAYAHRVRVIVVRQIEESRDIIRYLLDGESVMLNLENIDPKDCARVVDLLSGAAFALQGRMLKVVHLCYLLAPQSIDIVEADLYGGSAARYR